MASLASTLRLAKITEADLANSPYDLITEIEACQLWFIFSSFLGSVCILENVSQADKSSTERVYET